MSAASASALVAVKGRGGEHAPAEIEALVAGYTAGQIDDTLMTRWLRAVCERGMTFEETAALTRAMALSGSVIDWSDAMQPVVDKHSTGGVGDAVSLVAVPLAAACGVKVAKLSGRALGHTGGTIDKLECIPGLRTALSMSAFKAQVLDVGCAIAAATANLAPADKKIYDLRHRTGTVESIPLIAASVMSKKIAGGADTIVLDVKCGRGAFMRTLEAARELAQTMVAIGQLLGRRVRALISEMDAPLAHAVGDALEMVEALEVLAGGGSPRLRQVAVEIAAAMIESTKTGAGSVEALRASVQAALQDDSAHERFAVMVAAQGGQLEGFDRALAPRFEIGALRNGYVAALDAHAIGQAVAAAKSGLSVPEARRVGVRIKSHVGDPVRRGESVLQYYGPFRNEEWVHALRASVNVADRPPEPSALLLDRIG